MHAAAADGGASAGGAGLGHSRVVRILLNKGASTSEVNDVGLTAIFMGVMYENLAITKELVKAGASLGPCLTAPYGVAPLHMAAESGNLEIMHVLIEAGANINSHSLNGSTPILAAAQLGKINAIKMLLRSKADPLLTMTNNSGRSFVPLDVAARNGHLEVVRELIRQCGVEGCGGASGGVDALDHAARHDNVDIMAMLADAGVVDTGAALSGAAGLGREAPVKFLLQQQRGKTIGERDYLNHRDINGSTPLMCAVGIGSPRVVRLLVDAEADVTSPVAITNASRYTPLAFTTGILRHKICPNGKDATEDQLHRLEGIRRLLLRVEAVHAVSWLWDSDTPSLDRAAEGATTSEMTSAPLASMLPLLRRRTRRRGVSWATLVRHSQKKY